MGGYYRTVSREWKRRPWLGYTGMHPARYRLWCAVDRIFAKTSRWHRRIAALLEGGS